MLPFKYSGANADLTALAEGLTEEIVTGLSRFSYLRVIARGSTLQFTGEAVDVRSVGAKLGARYVIEGSLRQAGSALRVSVQLVDTNSGAHLWAETYDRPFQPENIFALQDDLAPRIVSTVADAHGVLPHTLSEALRSKDPEQLTPYEAVLRSFGYGYRMTPEEHAVVRACLERAVQQAPGYADAWGMLSLLYTEEFSNGFNARPDPLGRALQAARRAADAAPSSALAYNALARALFFRKEFQAFRIAADRALELNPLNGPTRRRPGRHDGVCGRLGARLRPGRAGPAAQSAASRRVLVSAVLQRVSPGRLPRGAERGAQDQPAGFLRHPRGPGGRIRAARGT